MLSKRPTFRPSRDPPGPKGDVPLSIQRFKTSLHKYRRWLVLLFSVAVTFGMLFFVFLRIDRVIFVRLLLAQDRRLLTVATIFVLLQIILGGERWRAILSAFTASRVLPMLGVQPGRVLLGARISQLPTVWYYRGGCCSCVAGSKVSTFHQTNRPIGSA